MFRHCWLGFIVLVGLCSVLPAKQGLVKTNQGQSIQGDIDDQGGDAVTIKSHGVSIAVNRSDIASIDYSDDLQQQFKDRLAALGEKNVKGRLDLAAWAIDHQQYDLARQAAQEARTIDPTNADVQTMLATIQSTQALQTQRPATAPSVAPAAPPEQAAPAETHQPLPKTYLSDDDVNTIRQLELRDTDAVNIRFANDVRSRYLALSGADAVTFNNLSNTAQALTLLGTGNSTLTRDILIATDPKSMVEFHTRILPRVVAGCASSGCHGGGAAVSFFLYPNAKTEAQWYTDFYILQNTHADISVTDVFGAGRARRPLIDRINPDNSPLLQFGLPPELSTNPHPPVKGFKPLFVSPQDPMYAKFVTWIETLRPAVATDYGIGFPLPGVTAQGKAPSTQAAAGAVETPAAAPAPAVESAPPNMPADSSTTQPAPEPMLNK